MFHDISEPPVTFPRETCRASATIVEVLEFQGICCSSTHQKCSCWSDCCNTCPLINKQLLIDPKFHSFIRLGNFNAEGVFLCKVCRDVTGPAYPKASSGVHVTGDQRRTRATKTPVKVNIGIQLIEKCVLQVRVKKVFCYQSSSFSRTHVEKVRPGFCGRVSHGHGGGRLIMNDCTVVDGSATN